MTERITTKEELNSIRRSNRSSCNTGSGSEINDIGFRFLKLKPESFLTTGPRTLQLKLQKMPLSSIHITTFFPTSMIFSSVLYMGKDFTIIVLGKSLQFQLAVTLGLLLYSANNMIVHCYPRV